MNFKSYIFITALISSGVTLAQNQVTLDLKTAVNRGLGNSAELKISEGQLQEAQQQRAEAGDHFLPNVGVSGTYLRINTPSIKFANSGSSSDSSSGSPLSGFSNLHSLGLAQVSASLPLFEGLKLRNEEIMKDYLAQAAQYDTANTRDNVVLNTLKAFYNYYELTQTKQVVEENLKQAKQRVKELTDLENQGLLSRNDRLKAELQADNIELGLTDVSNNLQLAEYNLILLLGYPEGTTIELDTTGMFTLSEPGGWEDYLQKAMDQRNDLKAAEMRVKATESNYKVAKADRFPSLSLSAGYVNAWLPNVLTVNNALNAGIGIKYSITGALEASHHLQEMKAQQIESEARQQLLNDQVKLEIRRDYQNYQQALDKLVITQRAIEQAEENFQITDSKYRQGLALLSDYLDANASLLQAKINYSINRVDAMMAYYSLEASAGTLNL